MRRLTILVLTAFVMPTPASAQSVAIPVPAAAIRPGETLADALLVDRKMIVNEAAARAYAVEREQVVGLVARRVLAAGAPIPLGALRRPWVFKEGERVAVQFQANGLTIRGSAVALSPGTIGEDVSVRNAETGVTIRGVVSSDGSVLVEGSR